MKISMRPVERVGCPTKVQFGIPTFAWGGISQGAIQVNMTVAKCDTFMDNLMGMLNDIDGGNRGDPLKYKPPAQKIEQMHDQTFSGEEYHLMEHFSSLVGKIHELVDAVNEIRGEEEE